MSNIDILRDELIYELNKCFCDDVGQYPECENCKKIRRYMSLISEQVVAGEFDDDKAYTAYEKICRIPGSEIVRAIDMARWQHSKQKRISELTPSELLQNDFVRELVGSLEICIKQDGCSCDIESVDGHHLYVCHRHLALEPFEEGE